jgi:hypothetical protein
MTFVIGHVLRDEQRLYPVRRETGISRESSSAASKDKGHIESDNRNFLRDLEQFVVGN